MTLIQLGTENLHELCCRKQRSCKVIRVNTHKPNKINRLKYKQR